MTRDLSDAEDEANLKKIAEKLAAKDYDGGPVVPGNRLHKKSGSAGLCRRMPGRCYRQKK